jgi:hypothetical protein
VQVPVEIHERDVLRSREQQAVPARAARAHEQVPVVDAQADVAEGRLDEPLDREHPARERDEPPLGRMGNGHGVVSSCSPRNRVLCEHDAAARRRGGQLSRAVNIWPHGRRR